MEQLAGELGGRVRVAKVNVDDCPDAVARMGIRGIPSILLIKDGSVIRKVSAGSTKAMLAQVQSDL